MTARSLATFCFLLERNTEHRDGVSFGPPPLAFSCLTESKHGSFFYSGSVNFHSHENRPGKGMEPRYAGFEMRISTASPRRFLKKRDRRTPSSEHEHLN